jgi:hypothetical protein
VPVRLPTRKPAYSAFLTPWDRVRLPVILGQAYRPSKARRRRSALSHDFRGTAITRLAIAGATVPGIAAITGHSFKTVQDILDKHYVSRDQVLAENAIIKLERAFG